MSEEKGESVTTIPAKWLKIKIGLNIKQAFLIVTESYQEAVIRIRLYSYCFWTYHNHLNPSILMTSPLSFQATQTAFNSSFRYYIRIILKNKRGFSKTSVFGKATLDLVEKPVVRLVFPKPFPKLTEFWKWLKH